MIGGILAKVAFVTCCMSVLAYYQNHRQGNPAFLRLGRIFYHATVAFIIGTAAVLLYLILTHQFQYTYIWSESSRALPLPLLISTFYAGQEGSFMLWTLYTSLIGILLLHYSSRKGYEPQVMTVYGLITSVLLAMLMVKSPFTYVWESFPGEVASGFIPADGRGLNPLLQNYWMVIHPQVLFTGFASMSVPYAYAVAGMMKRDYTSWIKPAAPWLAFGALILGTGIIMGGFWAYETLGWGGYWGWDPVENSSLVPWLVCIAAVHSMLIQRKTGGFIRTNLVLSMLCFLMVLYSTFLTRSGVLGDTSVHSFVDPGMLVYWLLIAMIALFALLGGVLLFVRRKEIPRPARPHEYYSREFALFLGSSCLVAAALIIIVGTSSPIITDLLYGRKSAVDISYYVRTTVPLGIGIALLAGVGQLLWWSKSSKKEFLRSLLWPLGIAIGLTLILAVVAMPNPLIALLCLGAIFALAANVQVAARLFRGNPKFAGGAVAHVGVAVMILGFIASSEYDTKETVSLPQGVPVQALGYTLTYTGYRPLDAEKYAFLVRVEKDGRSHLVQPVMYNSDYTKGLMRNPDIVNLITHDFYLAPLSLEAAQDTTATPVEKSIFRQDETRSLKGLQVTFAGFESPAMQKASLGGAPDRKIGARLLVRSAGGTVTMVVPTRIERGSEVHSIPVTVDGRYKVSLTDVQTSRGTGEAIAVEVGVRDLLADANQSQGSASSGDVLMAEASVKPYINLVWSGVIVLLVGLGVTIVRRGQDAGKSEL